MYLQIVVTLLLPSAQSANILGFFMIPSISHQIVYQPIWRKLSLRGHNVTVITPNPLNNPKLTNLTEINVDYTSKFYEGTLFKMYQFKDHIAEADFNNTKVKELIADRTRSFDLILVEWFHPAVYAFAGRFKAPIIGVSSLGAFTSGYDVIGNPCHPVLTPDMLLGYSDKDLSLWQKTKSVAFGWWSRYHHDYILVPKAQEIVRRYFGDDTTNVDDFERSQSMLFLNVAPMVYTSRPNVPAVLEMGQMHIKPVKPLPKDLQDLLDQATEGVIYFSLGSNVKSVQLSKKLKNVIIGALSELPYKIIWKWESDHLPGKPSNVIVRKWLPQQDLLAHPNIRAFVTQGGLQSMEEAISREVPLVGMPFLGDQAMNVHKIVDLDIGLAVDPSTVTKDELKKCIIEVAKNKKYKANIKIVRNILLDRARTGLEKAVWWCEYVIRHKGAKHLRSPTADISWFDYLLVDVVVTTLGVIWGVFYLSCRLVQIFKNCTV